MLNQACPAGVVEGFFGRSWDWAARLSAVDFLGDHGYQFYIYAPKADAFLRRRWREPIPAETMQHLVQLSRRSQEVGLIFGIGLTPFEIYLNDDAGARRALHSKVIQINEIGAKLLCILFDDMRGDVVDLVDLQAKAVADICGWSNADHFIVCPTYYSYDSRLVREFGPAPKSYLRDLGRALDRRIDLFWSGEQVISERYSRLHLSEIAGEIGRKPFIWDNSISNDSRTRTNHLYLDPTLSGWEMPAELAAGVAINPMNQPHLSQIALCGFEKILAAGAARGMHVDQRSDACQSAFATELLRDAARLRSTPLNELAPDTRRKLLALCTDESANPGAREIRGWLHGEYAFDPQCLTS
jgi:hyaluronoglucosaminidase